MNRKILLRSSAGLAALLLVAVLLLVADAFVGNPIAARMARERGREYLEDRYAHLNLEIEGVTYNPKDGSYSISVLSSTSMDTHFGLACRKGEIIADDYEVAVLSGMNTMDRFCDEYEKRLTPLVQARIGEVTHLSVMPEKRVSYALHLDAAFAQELVTDVEISIRATGGTGAQHLAGILKRTSSLMLEQGYAAARFSITGEDGAGALTELLNISPAQVESDDLEAILQRAITATEYEGIIAFSKSLK